MQHAFLAYYCTCLACRFLQMCAPLGVDPLQASKKSFWSQLLGMGDFYHELAVKVAEVSAATTGMSTTYLFFVFV